MNTTFQRLAAWQVFNMQACSFSGKIFQMTLCIVLFLGAGNLFAQTTWDGSDGTDWHDADNWSAGVPDATTDVIIANETNDPIIGAAAFAKSVVVNTGGVLTINASLAIDGATSFSYLTTAFGNNGMVHNNGTITIGATTSSGANGIWNFGTFNNNTGAQITIDRTTAYGIKNHNGTLNNAGQITIGATESVGHSPIKNRGTATFNNNVGGNLNLNRGIDTGITNEGIFNNAGNITMGAIAGFENICLSNYGDFVNLASGVIQLDNAGYYGYGLYNNPSATFVNAGEITIEAGSYSLVNFATFSNNACGKILMYSALYNSTTFTNAGVFAFVNNIFTNANSGLVINTGIIDYNGGSLIPGVTNNEIIVSPMLGTGTCGIISPVLSLGTTVDFDIATTWFLDENLTMPAGTFDEATNTFTSINLPIDVPTTVYYSVNDAVGGCSYMLSMQLTDTYCCLTDNTPPTVICPSNITVVADAGECCATASGDYTLHDVPFAPVAGTGTTITLFDDQMSSAIPIGFDFGFYGSVYSEFYIGSNGYITFTADTYAYSYFSPDVIPNGNTPNNIIAAVWDDLNPSYGGSIDYFTTGTAPNRILVVNYNDIPYFSNGNTPRVKTQILLYEASNAIEIQTTYINETSYGTMGIENADGTVGLAVPGRNQSNWATANEGKRFVMGVAATATDQCGVTITQTAGLAPGACFPVGITTNSFTAADPNGNETPCSFTVTVTTNDIFYADADGDSYGNAEVSVNACEPPTGYVANNTDCNDGNAAINPAATEICDNIDNDCNTFIDNSLTCTVLTGNNIVIANGDMLPTVSDFTDFGISCVSGPIARTFSINNPSNGSIDVTSITSTNPMFSVSGVTLPATIAANGSQTFVVTFSPTSSGIKTATISIGNGLSSYNFGIKGTASATACGAPITLNVSNISATTAKINWTMGSCATNTRLYYRRTAVAAWYVVGINAPTAFGQLSGLKPATNHSARTRSMCGTNTSALTATIMFNTLAAYANAENQENEPEQSEQIKQWADLKVSPNPTDGFIRIKQNAASAQDQTAQISVLDLSGKLVLSWNADFSGNQLNQTANIADLPAGMYVLRVRTASGQTVKSVMRE